MTQTSSTPAETTAPQAAWILAGVVENVALQPAPVASDEPFDPLAGIDEA